jgi:hypothetical protein
MKNPKPQQKPMAPIKNAVDPIAYAWEALNRLPLPESLRK